MHNHKTVSFQDKMAKIAEAWQTFTILVAVAQNILPNIFDTALVLLSKCLLIIDLGRATTRYKLLAIIIHNTKSGARLGLAFVDPLQSQLKFWSCFVKWEDSRQHQGNLEVDVNHDRPFPFQDWFLAH